MLTLFDLQVGVSKIQKSRHFGVIFNLLKAVAMDLDLQKQQKYGDIRN